MPETRSARLVRQSAKVAWIRPITVCNVSPTLSGSSRGPTMCLPSVASVSRSFSIKEMLSVRPATTPALTANQETLNLTVSAPVALPQTVLSRFRTTKHNKESVCATRLKGNFIIKTKKEAIFIDLFGVFIKNQKKLFIIAIFCFIIRKTPLTNYISATNFNIKFNPFPLLYYFK